ncbi:MAG: response regulator [Lachnospiraceae bacterium]|nr:response regulator [Lachnospiraceae bacterium]
MMVEFGNLEMGLVTGAALVTIIETAGIVASFIGIVLLLRREQSKASTYLLLADMVCLMLNIVYLMLLMSDDASTALASFKLEYFMNMLFFFFFAMFCINYLQLKFPKSFGIVWIFLMTIQMLKLWFEELRGGGDVFSNIDINDSSHGLRFITVTGGTLYKVNYGVICSSLAILILITIYRIIKTKDIREKIGAFRLLGAECIIELASLLSIMSLTDMDVAPIFSTFVIIILIRSVAKGELFNVTDEGRTWAFENIEPAIIIVDNAYGYLEANKSAKLLFPELVELKKNFQISEEIKDVFDAKEREVEIRGRIFYKKVNNLVQQLKRGELTRGYCLVLSDMTEVRKLMEEVLVERDKAEQANEAKSAFLSNMSHEIRTPMNAIVGMTEILMRSDLPSQERGYLVNIKNSGNSLLAIINDILDFSKIESGKLEIIDDEYMPMSMLSDLGMIFYTRVGDKDIEILYDIDKNLPEKLYGDALRIRQIIINIVNNAIKFTEEGFVKISIKVNEKNDDEVELYCEVEDSGQGIKDEDIDKLFGQFSQVDTKKNRNKEGTGLGLSICKRLVELMGGQIGVRSVYGEGSVFYFTLRQKLVSDRTAATVKEENKNKVVGVYTENRYLSDTVRKLAKDYNIDFAEIKDGEYDGKVNCIFTDYRDYIEDKQLVKELKDRYSSELIVLQNCMKENVSDKDAKGVNKPLYTLNFCQLMNGEETSSEMFTDDDVMNFTAEEAKILIVDDNSMNLKVATGILAPLKMQIDTAESGSEAIKKMTNKKYHIIFMDHMMPVMDGVETTQKIRETDDEYFKEVPIIALTANALSGAKEEFIAAGMNDFVAKPIDVKEITSKIKTWLPRNIIKKSGGVKVSDKEDDNLPDIPELDVSAGVKNSGGKELFISLLGDYYVLIDMKTEKIEKCLNDGMIKDYTIEVHALKNTSRMIGALELADMFYDLEQKGNEQDVEYLREKTPGVLKLMRDLKPVLKPYGEALNDDKREASADEIKEKLDRLKDAIDVFDLDGADAAMKELEEYKLPEAIGDDMNRMRAYVADVAMEDIIKLAEEMKSKL